MSRLLAVVVIVASAPSAAEERAPQDGVAAPVAGFDPTATCSLAGRIVAIERRPEPAGRWEGLHVLLDAGGRRYDVHLGPAWYVLAQRPTLAVDDRVGVTGSLRRWGQDTPVLLAVSIRKAGGVLRLRDARGIPLWAGCRRPPR